MKKTLLLLSVLLVNLFIIRAQWSLTGNAGTNPPTNFLGTTDAQKLIFKVNNQQSGLLDYNTTGNTSFGYLASLSNTGSLNTSIGYQALYSNTSGSNNDAFGFGALISNSTVNANSAFGNLSLYSNTTGYNNFGFGCYSLLSNTTGTYNVASGGFSLYNNTSGSHNTALGYRALNANTIISNLTAAGYEALYSNTTGTSNTATGSQALYACDIGHNNTASGYLALYSSNWGEENTAFGDSVLINNSTGYSNTANGSYALFNNTTGIDNTAEGGEAGWGTTSGQDNTAIGTDAGYSVQTSTYCTQIGCMADVVLTSGSYTNTTTVGYEAIGSASNEVIIGNNQVTSIGGYVGWSNISDGRFKQNVTENVPGVEFIKQLRPVTYNLDVPGIDNLVNGRVGNRAHHFSSNSPAEVEAKEQKVKKVYTGFVAQEVEAVAKKANYSFSGIDPPKNDKDLYRLRYSDFVVPLVKSIQELDRSNDSLKIQISALQSQIIQLRQQLSRK